MVGVWGPAVICVRDGEPVGVCWRHDRGLLTRTLCVLLVRRPRSMRRAWWPVGVEGWGLIGTSGSLTVWCVFRVVSCHEWTVFYLKDLWLRQIDMILKVLAPETSLYFALTPGAGAAALHCTKDPPRGRAEKAAWVGAAGGRAEARLGATAEGETWHAAEVVPRKSSASGAGAPERKGKCKMDPNREDHWTNMSQTNRQQHLSSSDNKIPRWQTACLTQ